MRTRADIEVWALDVIESVRATKRVEDDRVELKRQMIDAYQAARRLGGHLNAARGEPVLWIVGIDETTGEAFDANEADVGTWWAQVVAHFDGAVPSTIYQIRLTVDDKRPMALYIDAPPVMVLKNPHHGRSRGEVEFEIPWRENTAVRTARRNDLLRMLVPLQREPAITILTAHVVETQQRMLDRHGLSEVLLPGSRFTFSAYLYVVPASEYRLVLPRHQCNVRLEVPGTSHLWDMAIASLGPESPIPEPHEQRPKMSSLTIAMTHREVIIDGPGVVAISAYIDTPANQLGARLELIARIEMRAALSDRSITLIIPLVPKQAREGEIARWGLK